MSNPDVTFVNNVAVSGFLNGVCNLSLSQSTFVPVQHADGTKVDIKHDVAVDLRFDLYCAQQIRDVLDGIITNNTKPAAGVN